MTQTAGRTAWGVAATAAAVVLVAAGDAYSGALTSAVTSVEARFSAAVSAERLIEEPAAPPATQAAVDSGRSVDAATRRASVAEIVARNRALVADNFTGRAAALESRQVQDSAVSSVAASPYGDVLGAGVSDITYDSVSVTGARARVSATVTVWQTLRHRGLIGPHHTLGPWAVHTASNREQVVADLVRVGAGWLMANSSWSFVPGYGP